MGQVYDDGFHDGYAERTNMGEGYSCVQTANGQGGYADGYVAGWRERERYEANQCRDAACLGCERDPGFEG